MRALGEYKNPPSASIGVSDLKNCEYSALDEDFVDFLCSFLINLSKCLLCLMAFVGMRAYRRVYRRE